MLRYLLITVLVFLFILSDSFAQELGYLNIRNYTVQEYNANAQNWLIVQDRRGVMYFGNTNGLVEYDGVNWRTIDCNKKTVRSLAIDSIGTVYVGAEDDLGYLKADAKGNMKYVSLVDKIENKELKFEDILLIRCIGPDVYFVSKRVLFCLRDGKIKTWDAKNNFLECFSHNNEVFIYERNNGIVKLTTDSFQVIKHGDFFAKKTFFFSIPIDKNKVLLGTFNYGLFVYDFEAAEKEDDDNIITPFKTDVDSAFTSKNLYCGIRLNDGNFAFGTSYAGVFILDGQGKLIRRINIETGLQNEMIMSAYQDYEGGLWLATNNGISRVDIASPFSFWNKSNGLKNSVWDVSRYKGTIYIASMDGVHYIKNGNNKIGDVANFNDQCWTLLKINFPTDPRKEILYAGAYSQGVFQLDAFNGTLALNNDEGEGEAIFKMYQSKLNPARLYVGTSKTIKTITYDDNSLRLDYKQTDIDDEVRTIAEDKNGDVWLGTISPGVIRIIPVQKNGQSSASNRVVKYGLGSGLPSEVIVNVFPFKNRLIFATDSGLFCFDESKEKFYRDSSLGKSFCDGSRAIIKLVEDNTGKVWISGKWNGKFRSGVAVPDGKDYYKWIEAPFKTLPQMDVMEIFVEDKNTAWICGDEGLYRFNGNLNFEPKSFNTLIRKITVGKDTLIYFGTENESKKKIELKYQFNSITFWYAAASYVKEDITEYQSYLEGFDDDWTNWSKDYKRPFTNLTDGHYIFHVKSRNIYEVEGKEAIFEFTILPPWYRTIWAYVLYIILSLAVVYCIVFLNSRRLKADNIKLEGMVMERTAEIIMQKEEIEAQRDHLQSLNNELNNKNAEITAQRDEIDIQRGQLARQTKDITDSIVYASRIQHAMLPSDNELHNTFSDSFILFLPRDIVSGDFYWIKQVSDYFVFVAADCTGHGVPGAFMSMLGLSLLNELVAIRGMFTPNLVLGELRKRLKDTLHQHGQKGQTQDGMDIAFGVIDLKNNELQFAGAYNSLYLIREDENIPDYNLSELKADRMPIGVHPHDHKDFTNHTIQLKTNDSIYIFSDGYVSQFGGEKGDKFKSSRFQNLLLTLQEKPMEKHKEILENQLTHWRGERDQVDDILVIGIRV